ncbi:uncharacterized protein [Chamaea fasciata]|uniref:uncharacterized protein n=1 Tax=Chamaea fasciata TaxID=190680 RepID=UPI00336A8027
MEPREVLELLVAPVATLGKLAATVTAPRRRVWPLLYPESLHADLRRFTWRLRDTLDHGNVTSLHQCGVTPLGQALAALKATPGATRDNVRAAARAWWELMFVFEDRWAQLSWESRRLLNTMEDKAIAEAITEDTNEATTTGLAREEAVVATRQAGVATKREERMEEAWELLERFLDACDKAIVFPWKLLHQLWYIKAALEGTEEVSPDVPKALVTMVAKAELLWEASAHLTTCHLLVTLREIDFLLSSSSPCVWGDPGGPGWSLGLVEDPVRGSGPWYPPEFPCLGTGTPLHSLFLHQSPSALPIHPSFPNPFSLTLRGRGPPFLLFPAPRPPFPLHQGSLSLLFPGLPTLSSLFPWHWRRCESSSTTWRGSSRPPAPAPAAGPSPAPRHLPAEVAGVREPLELRPLHGRAQRRAGRRGPPDEPEIAPGLTAVCTPLGQPRRHRNSRLHVHHLHRLHHGHPM